MQLDGPHLEAAQSVRSVTQGNIAAVRLRQEDWAGAAAAATEALSGTATRATRVKLLYRRGVARRRLGQTGDAVRDLREAAALAPDDVTIRRQLLQAEAQLREVRWVVRGTNRIL